MQLREQTCSQVLANGSEVELPVVRCGLSDLTAQRTCKESLCKPRWVSRAYNCCDSRASQGLACTDMFSGDDIRDQACHDRVAELNLTVPTPAPCTPACPTTGEHTSSSSRFCTLLVRISCSPARLSIGMCIYENRQASNCLADIVLFPLESKAEITWAIYHAAYMCVQYCKHAVVKSTPARTVAQRYRCEPTY